MGRLEARLRALRRVMHRSCRYDHGCFLLIALLLLLVGITSHGMELHIYEHGVA